MPPKDQALAPESGGRPVPVERDFGLAILRNGTWTYQDSPIRRLPLVRAGRPESSPIPDLAETVLWGPGPRASQALMLTVRVRALLEGRFAPSVEDVIALAAPVLRHRMALTFTARAEGATIEQVIDRLTAQAL